MIQQGKTFLKDLKIEQETAINSIKIDRSIEKLQLLVQYCYIH